MRARQHAIPASVVFLVACASASPMPASESSGEAPDHLSPVSVVAGGDGKTLYVALATADQVAVIDAASGKITAQIPVGPHPVGLAMSADKSRLYVASAAPAGHVQVVDVPQRRVTDSIAVGHTPVAVVPGPNNKTLYVCNQFSNTVGVIDLDAKNQVATIAVAREPVAAALTADGRFLFVANHLPTGPADADYVASVVSVIDTAAQKVVKNIELPDGSVNLRGITISPNGRYAYVTHILARYKFPTTYLEKGWVNTNAMTVIDVPEQEYVNTVLVDDANLGAANPHGVVCSADGRHILITHAGTHEISVVDRTALHARLLPARSAKDFTSASSSTATRTFDDPLYCAEDAPNDLTFMAGLRRRVRLAGNGPRGLTVIDTKVYVAEYFTDSIGVVDIGPGSEHEATSIPLGPGKTLTEVRMGEMLFHDASHSFQKWHSCASCHSGNARACALNWDLLNDGILNPKNTKSLLLSHSTAPAMATGVRPNAETAVRSGIRYIQFTYPLEKNARAIDEYLKCLTPMPSPCLVAGRLSSSAENGERLFNKAGCASCHAGPLYTNMGRYDVGTGRQDEAGRPFDTPTLVEVWRTAPYLHDGRAVTIKEVLTQFNQGDKHCRTSDLTDAELADLAEYILTR